MKSNPDVVALLDELRGLGATVTTRDAPYAAADIARAEASLGFSLPEEYAEFLHQLGSIAIELERTWFFYGLDDGLAKTREYAAEFDSFRGDESGAYYPRRFIVLGDEGDFSNLAAGTVHDADLEAMLVTDGGRWVDREDAFAVGYWGWLLDELTEIKDRIADPEDPLVG